MLKALIMPGENFEPRRGNDVERSTKYFLLLCARPDLDGNKPAKGKC